ncbi:hypothetical protein HK101_010774 [Irineochytrium annulatum]|nr:hypothetical protein HK101_010774 [Irineochytrium annulatum]
MDSDATLHRVPDQAHRNDRHLESQSPASPIANVLPQTGIFRRMTNWSKFALLWSIAQFIIISLLEGIVLAKHLQEFSDLRAIQQNISDYNNRTGYVPTKADNDAYQSIQGLVNSGRAITVYESLFLFSQAYQLYLAFDSIISSSKIQLLCQTLFNLSVVSYSFLQYSQSNNLLSQASNYDLIQPYLVNFTAHRTALFEIIVIVMSLLFFLVWCFLSSKLYNIFGWSIFKELGADLGVRHRLRIFHIYVMLLKVDVFFFIGFTFQYTILVIWVQGYTYKDIIFITYTFISPLLAIILLLLAYFSVVKESNILMALNLAGLSGAVGFLVSRQVDIFTTSDPNKYQNVKNSLTLFIAITGALALATFAVAILNFRNFGKGLMEALKSKDNRK